MGTMTKLCHICLELAQETMGATGGYMKMIIIPKWFLASIHAGVSPVINSAFSRTPPT